jgi:hypothetical protein
MIYWVIKEKKAWNLTLEVLEKSGKLNVKKKYFRILGGFNSATDKPRNPNVKGTLVGFIIAIGFHGVMHTRLMFYGCIPGVKT